MLATLVPTPVADIAPLVNRLRKSFALRANRDADTRIKKLRQLVALVNENEAALVDALHADLGKPRMEACVAELDMVRNEAWSSIEHLAKWMAPRPVETEGVQRLDPAYTYADPLGTVLIIGAWNYPIQLVLVPLIGAIAAGNTVVVKPSEVSVRSANVLTQLLNRYFSPEDVAVVNGGVAETTALLEQRFDHIMYTGNGRVGRIVMAAASKNLTPVTLELGGKSPVWVDRSANVAVAARRIIWGRCVNAGQTCIAPDYVLAHPDVKDKLIAEMKNAVAAFCGANPRESKDYARIVNDMHFKRLRGLLSGGTVVVGGETDEATRYIAPTVLDNVKLDSPLMTDEIFGPLLPVIACGSADEAINFINDRDKPLALYVFSDDSAVTQRFLDRTSSGGVTINDTLMHVSVESLPFGGVGCSGMGAYHGKLSFDVFSHTKSVLVKPAGLEFVNDLRYPPYTDGKLAMIRRLIVKSGTSCCGLPSLHAFITFMLFVAVVVLAVLLGTKKTC